MPVHMQENADIPCIPYTCKYRHLELGRVQLIRIPFTFMFALRYIHIADGSGGLIFDVPVILCQRYHCAYRDLAGGSIGYGT